MEPVIEPKRPKKAPAPVAQSERSQAKAPTAPTETAISRKATAVTPPLKRRTAAKPQSQQGTSAAAVAPSTHSRAKAPAYTIEQVGKPKRPKMAPAASPEGSLASPEVSSASPKVSSATLEVSLAPLEVSSASPELTITDTPPACVVPSKGQKGRIPISKGEKNIVAPAALSKRSQVVPPVKPPVEPPHQQKRIFGLYGLSGLFSL